MAVMTYTQLDVELVGSILHTESVVCVYQVAANLALASTIMHALDILPQMESDGIILVERKSGHAMIYHMIHCARCGWCPIRHVLRHGDYAVSLGHETHFMDNVSQARRGRE